jgi:hypothetical protein
LEKLAQSVFLAAIVSLTLASAAAQTLFGDEVILPIACSVLVQNDW